MGKSGKFRRASAALKLFAVTAIAGGAITACGSKVSLPQLDNSNTIEANKSDTTFTQQEVSKMINYIVSKGIKESDLKGLSFEEAKVVLTKNGASMEGLYLAIKGLDPKYSFHIQDWKSFWNSVYTSWRNFWAPKSTCYSEITEYGTIRAICN